MPQCYYMHMEKLPTQIPSNNKPSRFWNANFLPNISPSHYKPPPLIISPSHHKPPKKTFEKYKPRAYFRNFTVLLQPVCAGMVSCGYKMEVMKSPQAIFGNYLVSYDYLVWVTGDAPWNLCCDLQDHLGRKEGGGGGGVVRKLVVFIILHLSKRWKAKFFVLRDVIFLGEAVGGIWYWSLLGKEHEMSKCILASNYPGGGGGGGGRGGGRGAFSCLIAVSNAPCSCVDLRSRVQ